MGEGVLKWNSEPSLSDDFSKRILPDKCEFKRLPQDQSIIEMRQNVSCLGTTLEAARNSSHLL